MKKGKPAPRRNTKAKKPVAKMAAVKRNNKAAMTGALMNPQGPLGSSNY